MDEKIGKTAGKTMRTIRKHRLSTPEKYEAFRKEHRELNLPSHMTVMKRFAARRWDW